jgi:hypothetical protein
MFATIGIAGWCSSEVAPDASSSSCGAAIVQPRLRRVTPFSTQASLSCFRTRTAAEQATSIKTPLQRIQGNVFSDRLDSEKPLLVDLSKGYEHHIADTEGVLPTRSGGTAGVSAPYSRPYYPRALNPAIAVVSDHFSITEASLGGKSVDVPKIISGNGMSAGGNAVVDALENDEIRLREESFHDDRTSLPSQKKRRDRKSQPGGRRISLWF